MVILKIGFIWFVLIATYVLERSLLKKEKAIRNLYLLFSGLTAIFSIFLYFDNVLAGYVNFLLNIFGEVTHWVIGT